MISHRHGDHTSGLNALLQNAEVRVFVPAEKFGVFGSELPGTFYPGDESLPAAQRYYHGEPPQVIRSGTPWADANFVQVQNSVEILRGMHLISLVSTTPGTLEVRELSLSLDTAESQVLNVGRSHPGIEHIVEAAAALDRPIDLVFGGLHLLATPEPEIERIATALRDRWGVARIAPAHCSGEPAFRILREVFDRRFIYAGLGERI